MSNQSVLKTDHFDCPNCGIKKVTYEDKGSARELKLVEKEKVAIFHYLLECKRCKQITYFQILKGILRTSYPGNYFADTYKVLMQYPSGKQELPDYIPGNIRKYYREAIDAYNFGLLNSASAMCRRTIYELCDREKAQGKDYKEKIKDLGLDKRITDPLLNIKNIGDDSMHAKGWDKTTIEKALGALAIIIDMVYTQEQRIKDFSKHYSKTKQKRIKDKKNIKKGTKPTKEGTKGAVQQPSP